MRSGTRSPRSSLGANRATTSTSTPSEGGAGSAIRIVSSANLSASGELYNVELGLRVDDPALSQLVEAQLRDIEKDCYELVRP